MIPEFAGLIAQSDIDGVAQSEELIFDPKRSEILKAMHSIDVQACPGSGKTTLIAAKLILLAKKWPFSDRGVCVLSHTNVAKDEIIKRLKQSKTTEAEKLLGYPHFIGTIQEFVNRYLAMPFIRSVVREDIVVDNERYLASANKLLENGQFSWLRGTLNGLGNSDARDGFIRGTFRYIDSGEEKVNLSKRPRAWSKIENSIRAEGDIAKLKKYLDQRGLFLYRDMYTHAEKACAQSEELKICVAKRFPAVFLDEMQDTQLFQDELLANVFPHGRNDVSIQRFGDPDQAIFHGTGKEEPNKSYNGKSVEQMDFVIEKSHRFDNSIGTKTKKLSFNKVMLETESEAKAAEKKEKARGSNSDFEHTIIVFDDDSRSRVIETFAELVSEQFAPKYKATEKFTVKVVGAVGNEIDPAEDQLKIGHYWSGFDKSKSKNKYTPVSLIDAVYYCRHSEFVDWDENYQFLISSILKALRLSGKRDANNRHFTATSLREFLELNGRWGYFRKAIYFLLDKNRELNAGRWKKVTHDLAKVLDAMELCDLTNEFMAFSEDTCLSKRVEGSQDNDGEDTIKQLGGNKLKYLNEFEMELSTIHGVKGETHDATLLLETRFHEFDLKTMLPYLTTELARPTGKRKLKFMRQFYVAMSRPQHLLCLAIHSDRISESDKELLENEGWKIKEADSSMNCSNLDGEKNAGGND